MDSEQITDAQERLRIRREIVSHHVQIDRWLNSKLAEFTCPAGHPHAWAMIDGAMNLFCPGGSERKCHAQLQSILASIRQEVREQEGDLGYAVWQPTEQDRAQYERKLRYFSKVAFYARTARPVAFAKRKTVDDLRAASPWKIAQPVHTHWRLPLEHLFKPDDVIWIGERHDTSKPEAAVNFRCVTDWLKQPEDRMAYGPLWSPACWDSGTYYRRKTGVRHQDYFPVEGDAPVSLDDQATVLLWLARAYPLVSVTFSGRVSLHGLFCWSSRCSVESWVRLKAVLEAFEFDLANFRLGGTTRCPGWFREPDKEDMRQGAWQELLYLNPNPQSTTTQ